MKKIFALLILASLSGFAYAQETPVNQTVTVEDTKATVAVLKKPGNPESKQDARIKNVWFSIVVVCDGKVHEVGEK